MAWFYSFFPSLQICTALPSHYVLYGCLLCFRAQGKFTRACFPTCSLSYMSLSLISLFFNWAKNSFRGLIIGASCTNEQFVVQGLCPHVGADRKNFQKSSTWSFLFILFLCQAQWTPNTTLHSKVLGLNSPVLWKDMGKTTSLQYCSYNCVESLTGHWAESHY